MPDKPTPGGLRNPPGGRPPLPEDKRRVKISISLGPATIARLREQHPNEPLSQVIERLLREQP